VGIRLAARRIKTRLRLLLRRAGIVHAATKGTRANSVRRGIAPAVTRITLANFAPTAANLSLNFGIARAGTKATPANSAPSAGNRSLPCGTAPAGTKGTPANSAPNAGSLSLRAGSKFLHLTLRGGARNNQPAHYCGY